MFVAPLPALVLAGAAASSGNPAAPAAPGSPALRQAGSWACVLPHRLWCEGSRDACAAGWPLAWPCRLPPAREVRQDEAAAWPAFAGPSMREGCPKTALECPPGLGACKPWRWGMPLGWDLCGEPRVTASGGSCGAWEEALCVQPLPPLAYNTIVAGNERVGGRIRPTHPSLMHLLTSCMASVAHKTAGHKPVVSYSSSLPPSFSIYRLFCDPTALFQPPQTPTRLLVQTPDPHHSPTRRLHLSESAKPPCLA
jgi:hypothetical protein